MHEIKVAAWEPHQELKKVLMFGTVMLPKNHTSFQVKLPIFFEDGDTKPWDIPNKFLDFVGKHVRIIGRIIPSKFVGEREYRKMIVVDIKEDNRSAEEAIKEEGSLCANII